MSILNFTEFTGKFPFSDMIMIHDIRTSGFWEEEVHASLVFFLYFFQLYSILQSLKSTLVAGFSSIISNSSFIENRIITNESIGILDYTYQNNLVVYNKKFISTRSNNYQFRNKYHVHI